jgi:hypothetical protein
VLDVELDMFARTWRRRSVLRFEYWPGDSEDGEAAHIVCGGEKIVAEGAGYVGWIFGEAADYELHVGSGGGFNRGDEIDEAIGASAEGLAVGAVDGDTVDEDEAEVAVFSGTLGGGIGGEAFGDECFEGCVGNFEVELEAVLGAGLYEGLRLGGGAEAESKCSDRGADTDQEAQGVSPVDGLGYVDASARE